MLNPHLVANTAPHANEKQIVIDDVTRFTVIAPGLLRVERNEKGKFLDEATQVVWYRNLGEFPYEVKRNALEIIIVTSEAAFRYNRRAKRVVSVVLDGKEVLCKKSANLKGTCRTLDGAAGKRRLKDGVIGKDGVAAMDDTKSLVLGADGTVRENFSESDVYVFAGKEPREVLKTFFAVTGRPPLMPRYALGNWWSRYHEYTQEEYLGLMERFEKEGFPFSVATIDMDWHWVKIEKEFGAKYRGVNGWTGYTWNDKFFPDYKAFLRTLQEKGYKTSINLHPADGVRSYEAMYEEMCRAMGVPADGKAVAFDFTDPKFINAYFDVLHHPYEEDGLDVWWIDWQQGKSSKIKGYDPLWGLNHYHFLDHARDGKRPLILSRYSGLGSHRYPLGFSGDTFILWRMLNYLPYFTNTATNAGYITWSHDTGGHHFGRQEDQELYLRWVQYGVFSPILRLHSTKIAKSKEPWLFPAVTDEVRTLLQFRHKLIPYIYTAYYKSYAEGRALCEPMYYPYPAEKNAFYNKNQYMFGDNLLVAPITTRAKKKTGLASTSAWLPAGRWTDIFTGDIYEGGGIATFVREKYASIPVLAKAGSVLPLALNEGNNTGNPKAFELLAFSGNGAYTLYEDDGMSRDYETGRSARTVFAVAMEGDTLCLRIAPAEGDLSLIPGGRDYTVSFLDVRSFGGVKAESDGRAQRFTQEGNKIILKDINPAAETVLYLTETELLPAIKTKQQKA